MELVGGSIGRQLVLLAVDSALGTSRSVGAPPHGATQVGRVALVDYTHIKKDSVSRCGYLALLSLLTV